MPGSAIVADFTEHRNAVEERVRAARSEGYLEGLAAGSRTASESHQRHLRSARKSRRRVHRLWTIGSLLLVIGIGLSFTLYVREPYDGLRYVFLGAIGCFTVFHWYDWDRYSKLLKLKR